MKTRTSTLNHLIRQFRNTRKSNKKAGTKQRTSFTPAMENLETRALLTTMPGLTIEPTADAAAQVAASQKNDAAYIKFDGIMQAPDRTMPAHHAAIDQLFTQEGLKDFFNPATFR